MIGNALATVEDRKSYTVREVVMRAGVKYGGGGVKHQ